MLQRWEPNRLAMVLAVLDAHCGLKLAGHDVYLTVAGGMEGRKLWDAPAIDVAEVRRRLDSDE